MRLKFYNLYKFVQDSRGLKKIISTISIMFLKLAGNLPLPVLYIFSIKLYFLLYYVLGYRKKVVKKNISNSFPSQTEKFKKSIEKKYYKHLSDLIAENIACQHYSLTEVKSRCEIDQKLKDIVDFLYANNKSFIALLGHTGNWEWSGLATPGLIKHKPYSLYRPLKNKEFDNFFLHFRSHTGTHLITMQSAPRIFHVQNQEPVCIAFIADQSPPPEHAVWTTFLNQETGFFKGYEVLARRYNLPVVYVSQKKISKGRYRLYGEIITEDASKENTNQVVLKFVKLLEKDILNQPECWLWSHRRWKHKRPPGVQVI
ncbi:MAG: lysophospholipid acyltransferase family protein [Flavobacteriales bacterium]|nr:lysophospholipid acyltransferase family protein [Flavobacteriales bacterium]